MRIVLRQDVANESAALPFRRWRRAVARPWNAWRCLELSAGALHVGHIARAIGIDFAFDAHHQLRAEMPAERCRIIEDGCPAVDADAPALAVEADEQQPDI